MDREDRLESGRPEPGDEVTGEDRRRFLLRAGVLGAAGTAAWVTPTILSTSAAAAESAPPTSTSMPPIGCNRANFVNPSFENGIAGWTTTGSVFLQPYDGSIPTPPDGGSTFLFLSSATAAQTVAIDAACRGHAFQVSFWSASAPFGPPSSGSVRFAPGGQVLTRDVPPTSLPAHLAEYTVSDVVPPDAVSLEFTFTAPVAFLDLVDLFVTA
jgi:hypothetical protein